MSRFVYVAALLVCVGYAAAEGEGSMMTGFMQMLNSQIQAMDVAANCPKVCGDTCTLESSACVDIPDVLDCAVETAACNAACDAMCGCLAGCSGSCGSEADCIGSDPEAAIACFATVAACLGPCEAECTTSELTNAAEEELAKMSQQMSGMIAKLMALMPQSGQ